MKLRGLWKTWIDWPPQDERWSGPKCQYADKESLPLPFVLEDLIGDEVPEVIVAGKRGNIIRQDM